MNFNKLISLSVFLLIFIAFIYRINIIYKTVYPPYKPENFIVAPKTDERCSFKPAGNNELHCISLCKENENCYHFQCENICGKCDNNKCPWELKKETNSNLNFLKAVTISIETSEGSAKISFKSNNDNTEGYIYQLYKTNNKSDGITIGNIGNNKCITCEKVITNLDTRETYTISVKPYNKNGVGEESNKINFSPIGDLRTYDFNINSPIENLLSGDYDMCHENEN